MKIRNRMVQYGGCLLLAWFAGGSVARADCNDLLQQFQAALAARSVPDAKAVESKIAVDPVCGNQINDIKRQRSVLELIVVLQQQAKGVTFSDYEPLLVDASELQWQAAKLLGDVKFGEKKYNEASAAYERAIEIIKNRNLTPTDPDKKDIKGVLDRAVEARMLAANDEGGHRAVFVASAKDHRDGTPGGSMSEVVRGLAVNVVPLPINFETATANFSAVGKDAANELLKAVLAQNPPKLTLVGHTDQRGDADFNMKLSDQRAKAVATFLKQNGVTAEIKTVAKGKTEPFPGDTTGLSQDEIWALNRRVVWQRD